MNLQPTATCIEPRWMAYLKVVALLLPAAFFVEFANIYLYPKIKHIFASQGGMAADTRWALDIAGFIAENGLWIFGAVIATLCVIDFFSRISGGWRKLIFGSALFMLNTAALTGLAAMCITAILLAKRS